MYWLSERAADEIVGAVTDEHGRVVSDALVRLTMAQERPGDARQGDYATVAQSVYTDSAGRFSMPLPSGADRARLEVRKQGYSETEVVDIELDRISGMPEGLEVVLISGHDIDVEPAAAFLADRSAGAGGNATIMECVGCHQFPHPPSLAVWESVKDLDQAARHEFWADIVRDMRERYVDIRPVGTAMKFSADPDTSFIGHNEEQLITDFLATFQIREPERKAYASALQKEGRALLSEFEVPGQQGMLHDVISVPGPGGKRYLWAADFQNNFVVRVDPETAEVKRYAVPKGHSGPHSLIPDEDGALWITLNLSDGIAKFDPKDGSWKLYENFSHFSLPHSITTDENFLVRFDLKGRLWTSLIGRNGLASLDPATGIVEEHTLPGPEEQSPPVTRAYGVVMTSDRRSVWFTQVGGHGLGAMNTETGDLEFYKVLSYGSGPRRLAIDENDILWIPLYGAGALLKFDARTREELDRFDLPNRSSAPYVVSYDPIRKKVWIGTSNADVLYSFDVKDETFETWTLPRKGSFTRSVPVDLSTGCIITSYAQIPPAVGPNMIAQLDPGDLDDRNCR